MHLPVGTNHILILNSQLAIVSILRRKVLESDSNFEISHDVTENLMNPKK